MQEALLIPEIRPERFLDPSAGTGMFISTLKDVPEIHCFEKDRLCLLYTSDAADE
mgnify:CR=1 FL=1